MSFLSENPHLIRAKKSLGQNFLIDENALFTIAYACEIEGKNILEIGPGYGALTDFLISQSPQNLDLIELDDDMIAILKERTYSDWKHFQNLTIHHKDILKFSPQYQQYSVIANIPYYITSPILFHFLYPKNFTSPQEMVIMMQKEVGEKILEKPKKPKFSYLSLALHQVCENIESVCLVPKTSFQPAPKVDSIVLKFHIKSERNPQKEQEMLDFWNLCFVQPRKTLVSNLRGSQFDETKLLEILEILQYPSTIRSEAIQPKDWAKIFNHLKNNP